MITNKQKDDAIVAINEIKLIVSQILFYSSNSSLFTEIDSAVDAGVEIAMAGAAGGGGAEGEDAAAAAPAPAAAPEPSDALEKYRKAQLEILKTRLKTAQDKLKQNIQDNM